jgi:hypothetical protein
VAGFLLAKPHLPLRQLRNWQMNFQNPIFWREKPAKIAIFREIAVKRFR